MRGLMLIGKNKTVFEEICQHLKKLDYPFGYSKDSAMLESIDGNCYLQFFDESEPPLEPIPDEEDPEVPQKVVKAGYRYECMVLGRDINLFCNVMKPAAGTIDLLVLDDNGKIHTLFDLKPNDVYL